jgi:hypothetical protein
MTSRKPPFGTALPSGTVEEKVWPSTPKTPYGPTIFYIEGSDGFAMGKYDPKCLYRLSAAESLAFDDLRGKKINFAATSLYLSKVHWQGKNNGMLNFRLYLTKPIHIPGEGPVKPSSVDKLDFALPFKNASKAAFVPNVNNTPMFRDLDIDKYLSDENGAPSFDLELILAKSEGTNSNTVIDTASKILEDKTASAALSAVPYFGVASAVFRIIREVFFSYTGQAKEVWPSLKTTFRGKPGLGFPLKAGRYAILSTTISMDHVVSLYSYMGGRLVDNESYKEVEDADQLYLDVYAK